VTGRDLDLVGLGAEADDVAGENDFRFHGSVKSFNRDAGMWELGSAIWAKFHSKWHVVAFVGRDLRFRTFRRRGGRTGGSRGGARGGGRTPFAVWGPNELVGLQIHSQFALLLVGLFIVPSVETQTAFDENRVPFLQILGDGFSGLAERIHVHKRHFFFGFAGLGFPDAIDGNTD